MYTSESIQQLRQQLENRMQACTQASDYKGAVACGEALAALAEWQADGQHDPVPQAIQRVSGLEWAAILEEIPPEPDPTPNLDKYLEPDEVTEIEDENFGEQTKVTPAVSLQDELTAVLNPFLAELSEHLTDLEVRLMELPRQVAYRLEAEQRNSLETLEERFVSSRSPWLPALLAGLLTVLIVLGGVWFLLEQYTPSAALGSAEIARLNTMLDRISARETSQDAMPTSTPLPPEAAMLMAEQTLAPRLTEIAQANGAALSQISRVATVEAQQATVAADQATAAATLNIQASQQAQVQATLTPQAASARATATAIAQREATVAAREFALEEAASRSNLAAPGQFAITFPPDGVEFYVAPWQIQVEANVWLPTVDNYRLTLTKAGSNQTSAVLAEFQLAPETLSYTYERGFENNTALFDSFPGLDDAGKAALGLDANGQLPPGDYILGIEAEVAGGESWQSLPVARTFVILESAGKPPLTARIKVATTLYRILGPDILYPRRDGSIEELLPDTVVTLIGRFFGTYQNAEQFWYLVETQDETPRRSWVLYQFLDGPTDAELDGIAELAPSSN